MDIIYPYNTDQQSCTINIKYIVNPINPCYPLEYGMQLNHNYII